MSASAASSILISLRASPAAVRPLTPSSMVIVTSPSADSAMTSSVNTPLSSIDPDTSVTSGSAGAPPPVIGARRVKVPGVEVVMTAPPLTLTRAWTSYVPPDQSNGGVQVIV